MAHFCDVLHGPPTSWVSPSFSLARPHSPSPNPLSNENEPPPSLGEGQCGWLRVELAGVLVIKPTSLDRGEGLVVSLLCVVEGAEGRW